MSTWISDPPEPGRIWRIRCSAARATALCLIPVAVAGCLSLGGGKPVPAVRQAQLMGAAVIVPAPVGYCIEPGSLKDEENDAFVLIGRCDLLTGQEDSLPVSPAIMTVSVTRGDVPEGGPGGDDLVRSLGAERILTRIDEAGLSLFWVDSAQRVTRSGDNRHWRGIMTVNGHTVGLAAYGPRDSNISGKGGEALIRALARRIRNASPDRPTESEAPAASDNSEGDPFIQTNNRRDNESGGLKKLFGHLFN